MNLEQQYFDSVNYILTNHKRIKQNTVKDTIGIAALYEQLAEECTELGKAALKKSRKLRGENPTPLTNEQIDNDIIEELTDIKLVVDTLGIKYDKDIYMNKLNRWVKRVKGEEVLNEDHTS